MKQKILSLLVLLAAAVINVQAQNVGPVEVSYDNGSAKFKMPAYKTRVSYELARDLSKKMDLHVINFPVRKEADGSYSYPIGLPIYLKDVLLGKEILLDEELMKQFNCRIYIEKESRYYEYDKDYYVPGEYRIELYAIHTSPYSGSILSNPFTVYEGYDLTFEPADMRNIFVTEHNRITTPKDGKIIGAEVGYEVKISADEGYVFDEVSVNNENVSVQFNDAKTKASFIMPSSDMNVNYSVKRDLTVDFTLIASPIGYLRITKDENNQFQLVESDALTPIVKDERTEEILDSDDYTVVLEKYSNGGANPVNELSVGTFRLAITGKGDYAGTIYSNDFILYQKDITKHPVAKTELVYTGEPIVLIEAAEWEGGEMYYSTDGENWSKELPTGTDAGTYNVYYKVVTDYDDDDTDYETLEGIVISQAETELAYENADGLFATVEDPFTAPTLTNPHGLTVSYSSGDDDIADVDSESGEVTAVSAGEVTITATFAGNRNYLEGSAQYTLTVTDKRTLRAGISDATTFYNDIKDNDYYAAISSALAEAIATAETVNGNTTATQDAIDEASDAIAAAYQQAMNDKEMSDQLIAECTTPELTAAPGEKIALKVNISSGIAPFTISWTDTKGEPMDEPFSTSTMNEDITVSTIAAYSGTYTVTITDAQQKVYTGESQLTVEGQPLVASFDDLALDDESFHNGSDRKGFFISGGYRFETGYLEDENGSYAYGFAYSNRTSSDFKTYAADRYNSCVGGGSEDSPYFAVFKMDRGHRMGAEVLGDEGDIVSGFYITNAASTYQAMVEGTDLARQFGKGDWLKVTITGIDAQGTETGSVDYYLADFRDPNAAYIVETWRWVDLTELGKVKRLIFTMSGSDVNPWGSMNTPEYFCLDKLGGEKPEHEEPLLTSICLLETHRDAEPLAIYNVNGMQLPELRPGINIVKYTNGTTKKILMK